MQLVIGLGSTRLPLRAERIWIGQQIVFSHLGFTRWRSLARGVCDRSARGTKFTLELFLSNVTGEMQSPWTLPIIVVSKSSDNRVLASRLCSHFSSRHSRPLAQGEHSAACCWVGFPWSRH